MSRMEQKAPSGHRACDKCQQSA